MSDVLELFGHTTSRDHDWQAIVARQRCPYLAKKCIKVRKSEPEISIGTCSVSYGRSPKRRILICPFRLLERNQIFLDCIHLLSMHEPGNELHAISEVSVPGGSVDYFLVSVRNEVIRDFVGLELQTMDTTGSVWPARQQFLLSESVIDENDESNHSQRYGMNWKMTAKTILIQLHHKIRTFEAVSKHLVLVIQDHLLEYLQSNFSFDHVSSVSRAGDSMQFHVYEMTKYRADFRLSLTSRKSTNSEGLAFCLGLKAQSTVALDEIIMSLENKISDQTLLTVPSHKV